MKTKQYNALSSFIWNIANDVQVAQITFNDDIVKIVAAMSEEKTEFVQTYFANQDFQNFVNARVFQATINKFSNK